jgi:hypothetical protein
MERIIRASVRNPRWQHASDQIQSAPGEPFDSDAFDVVPMSGCPMSGKKPHSPAAAASSLSSPNISSICGQRMRMIHESLQS